MLPLPGDGFHDLAMRVVQPIRAILAGVGGGKKEFSDSTAPRNSFSGRIERRLLSREVGPLRRRRELEVGVLRDVILDLQTM